MNTPSEKSDLYDLFRRQYANGFEIGRKVGFDEAKELHGAIRRDNIVIAFCTGAAIGLLIGMFAL